VYSELNDKWEDQDISAVAVFKPSSATIDFLSERAGDSFQATLVISPSVPSFEAVAFKV
jgi:hypothetical protein